MGISEIFFYQYSLSLQYLSYVLASLLCKKNNKSKVKEDRAV